MMRNLISALCMAVAFTLGATATAIAVDQPEPPRSFWMDRPCKQEDGNNCVWDSSMAGINGVGHSFYTRVIPGTGQVCIFYAEREYAKTHDRCMAK